MKRIEVLSIVCSLFQIAGLILIILAKQLPAFTPVLIGIAGFAAIVNFCILDATRAIDRFLRPIAAVAGFGIIIGACMMV